MNKIFENKFEGLLNSLKNLEGSCNFHGYPKAKMEGKNQKTFDKLVIFLLLVGTLARGNEGVFAHSEIPDSEQNGIEIEPSTEPLEARTKESEHLPHFELDSLPLKENSEQEEKEGEIDPELGILRLEEIEKNIEPTQPSAYLLGWVGYLRSDNLFAEIDPIEEGLFRGSLTFLTLRNLGPNTAVFGAVGASTVRYQEFSELDYNQLSLNAGISQRLFQGTYGELGWSNQQLFIREGDFRFLNDHSAYVQLRRQDAIAPRLTLDTSYLFRLSFAEPDIRSQTSHELGSSLTYSPYASLQIALDYDFVLSNFRNTERSDRYHQLLARLTYTLSPRSRLELFGGPSFGGSSDPDVDFNTFIFGVGLGFTLF
ncbi:MAG: hypothetical protein SVX43_05120 [Cyanobacteriota bacterium]|nr:hypothetical protein [Cyanobacteriota bacterium]